MAINLKEFKQTKYPNLYKSLKEHPLNGYKYLVWIKIDNKLYKKILGYSKKDNLTERNSNILLVKFKEDLEMGYTASSFITLNKLYDLYFSTLQDTQWTKNKQGIYNRYIKKHLGHKAINKIKQMNIQQCINNLSKQGYKPRTQKSILEVLKPMYKFAMMNKMVKEDPTIYITVKIPSQKKIVVNATKLFQKVFTGIVEYYKDNSFYQALFLFGFTGRRKSEILSLKWENIDFANNYYWIEDTKNNDTQKYELPTYLKEPLNNIKDNKKGLVFKSLSTGNKIVNIDRQMKGLKEFIEVKNLSLHYMRNILVSALAEQQIEAITLSAILGHKDINTINKYLSNNHYKSSQIGLNKVKNILDIDLIQDKIGNPKDGK